MRDHLFKGQRVLAAVPLTNANIGQSGIVHSTNHSLFWVDWKNGVSDCYNHALWDNGSIIPHWNGHYGVMSNGTDPDVALWCDNLNDAERAAHHHAARNPNTTVYVIKAVAKYNSDVTRTNLEKR